MASKPPAERFGCKEDGTIELGIGGPLFKLARPKIGQYRRFQESWTSDVVGAEGDESDGLSPVEAAMVVWWRMVVTELDTNQAGPTFPEDPDDVPPWLLSTEIVSESFKHWRTVPWVPGSKPSDRELAKGLEQIQPLLAREPGVLTGSEFEVFADLYMEAAKLGATPLDVDGMEFWQVAAMFGAHRPTPPADMGAGLRARDEQRQARNAEHARKRLAWREGRGPKPEEPEASPADSAFMLQFTQALQS